MTEYGNAREKLLELLACLNRAAEILPPTGQSAVDASLLGNWAKETVRFAPDMGMRLLHGKIAAALEKLLVERPAF